MWWFAGIAVASGFGDAASPRDGASDGGEGRDENAPELWIPVDDQPSPVVGGRPVREGKWDDAVGVVFFGAYVGCTGILIGPRVVLTAGHCVVGTDVSHVVIGSKDWVDLDQGEVIEVEDVIEYPDSQWTYDIAVLLLAASASYEPRPIALDCVVEDYLTDGAPVQIVGFGGTRSDGRDYSNTELNEVASAVVDKNCSEDVIDGMASGCNPAARPAGELVAGGGGKDACFGDSGGPLYLKTEIGDFVVGVTSRALLGVPYSEPCEDGGIWVRPDAVMEWIADVAGSKKIAVPSCNLPPAVQVPELRVRGNRPETVQTTITDPDGDPAAATLTVAVAPSGGEVTVDGTAVTYTPDRDFAGEDTFTLAVTDNGADYEWTGAPVTTEIVVPVVVRREVLGMACATAPAPLAPAVGWLGLLALTTAAWSRGSRTRTGRCCRASR